MRRCSTSFIIREMQIKATTIYRFTLTVMAIIKKKKNHKCCWECGETGTLVCCWWECTMVQLLWEKVWWCFKNIIIINRSTIWTSSFSWCTEQEMNISGKNKYSVNKCRPHISFPIKRRERLRLISNNRSGTLSSTLETWYWLEVG